jgi:hypothetical protein
MRPASSVNDDEPIFTTTRIRIDLHFWREFKTEFRDPHHVTFYDTCTSEQFGHSQLGKPSIDVVERLRSGDVIEGNRSFSTAKRASAAAISAMSGTPSISRTMGHTQ